MITMSQLTELLGWGSVINIAYLFLAMILLITLKGPITVIHQKMFGLHGKDLSEMYFRFLSNYKIVTLVFFVAPYLALKIMGF